jgi:hypothetical protein
MSDKGITIENGAFYGCGSLKHHNIPKKYVSKKTNPIKGRLSFDEICESISFCATGTWLFINLLLKG